MMALVALGLSGVPFHETFHALPRRSPDADYGTLPPAWSINAYPVA
jgi:hypothetical protein